MVDLDDFGTIGLGLGLLALASMASGDGDDGSGQAPNAELSVETDGLSVTADGSGSSDPDGEIVDYIFEWGDGTASGGSATIEHAYDQPGTYTITLTIGDFDENIVSTSETVEVSESGSDVNEAPVADMQVTVDGNNVHLDGSGSFDADGHITEINWNLKQGGGWGHGFKTGETATFYDLEERDDWSVFMNVYDNDGGEASLEKSFTIGDSGNDDGGSDSSESPTALINYSVSGADLNATGRDSFDPDGEIVGYEWVLIDGSGSEVDTGTGVNYVQNLSEYEPGEFILSLTVEDDGGNPAQEVERFQWEPTGPDFDHTATFAREQILWHEQEPTAVTVETTGPVEFDRDPSNLSVESLDNGHTRASFTITNDLDHPMQYAGDIVYVDWASHLNMWLDGSRVDPYAEWPHYGPRYRSDAGSNTPIEITIRSSAAVYSRSGNVAARQAAEYLAAAFDQHDLSYDILYDLPPFVSPNERTGCRNPFDNDNCRDDGCTSLDCCSVEGAEPAAYYFFQNHINGNFPQLVSDWEEWSGQTIDIGEAFVRRKDSNVLLTDVGGGGCGAVFGNVAVVGGGPLANDMQSPETAADLSGSGDQISSVHNVAHEVGHNLGSSHVSDDPCSEFGGHAWVDVLGRWNRTATVGGNGCENMCGFHIEDRAAQTDPTEIKYATYTDCDVSNFVIQSGSQGFKSDSEQTATTFPACDHCTGLHEHSH